MHSFFNVISHGDVCSYAMRPVQGVELVSCIWYKYRFVQTVHTVFETMEHMVWYIFEFI